MASTERTQDQLINQAELFYCGKTARVVPSDSWQSGGLHSVDYSASALVRLPSRIELNENIISLCCMRTVDVVLSSNGDILVAGVGTVGQLGIGNHSVAESFSPIKKFLLVQTKQDTCDEQGLRKNDPMLIPQWNYAEPLSPIKIVQICCGEDHALALSQNGIIFSWGANDQGQLGLGHFIPQRIPVGIPYLSECIQITSSSDRSAAIDRSGHCYVWGRTKNNQKPQEFPVLLCTRENTPAIGIKHISLGPWSIVVSGEILSSMYTAGSGQFGRLGTGSTAPSDYLAPLQFDQDTSSCIAKISVGETHTLVLTTMGRIWSWGGNRYGQNGVGNKFRQLTPVEVIQIDSEATENIRFVDVIAGNKFSLALDQFGQCYFCGQRPFSAQADYVENFKKIFFSFNISCLGVYYDRIVALAKKNK